MPKLRVLDNWFAGTNKAQQEAAAKVAGTTLNTLRQYQHGRRKMTPQYAQRIAHATGLLQTELCEACGKCPLLKK
jgi:DNA-binding transcriptional regulator YdaS (Cro superfamily)